MKKFLLVSAALGVLFGVGAQAAPVAGPVAIQAEAAQDGAVQKVRYHGGHYGHYDYGHYGHYGYGRYGHYGYGRYGYGYDRGYRGDYDRR
jgi:opacity protein-like surface antigen